MSRIAALFNKSKSAQKKVLNVYCTAGYPALDSTLEVMGALQRNGADLIELGMPYSDPLADGEVIQQSGGIALENGMTIARLFDQLKDFRKVIEVPVVLMGYMNPVIQYGFENFCQKAAEIGIDGLILPDLPPLEFEVQYSSILKKHHLDFIFLVTPETTEARVRMLDKLSSGFLYAVSSSSTTGHEKDFSLVEKYLCRLQGYQLNNPILVGFGIKDKASFDQTTRYTDGAIIGSAYIKALDGQKDKTAIEAATKAFLKTVL
ncbi:tryptophan synthase subunit alpha [Arachidicoccus ginsenosidivorans]|jgi:tryptophan synthase alpha chain|uniref:Tryptophan synthase alpha chain n=1 Tax=Arachidicoccus ginsenosidivorans TaxID=496057 RepID=A0A5B8VNL8_9BACT|nr:tryptophan synthase subunit alpha [Arachidicoccus ginsenosidivorans]QEC72999.1 tryptophan synthase subunit alpha [Arachidicoccus ginsenosidivorans]